MPALALGDTMAVKTVPAIEPLTEYEIFSVRSLVPSRLLQRYTGFTPPLIYGGSEKVLGLEPNGLFQWRYENLLQGGSFEFIYQAYVPNDISANYIDGSINAYGIQGSDENGTGNNCEDTVRLSV